MNYLNIIPFIIEYILTNGNLPGFQERMRDSLSFWDIANEQFTVYRGQGHSKKGIIRPTNTRINILKNSVRPVISTSRYPIFIYHKFTNYNEKKPNICCLFEILVNPGIRYLDFDKIKDDQVSKDMIKDFLEMKKLIDPENKYWPTNKFPAFKLLDIFKDRKNKEHEIILDGYQGTFTVLDERIDEADNSRPMRVISVDYNPRIGGKRFRKTRRKLRL